MYLKWKSSSSTDSLFFHAWKKRTGTGETKMDAKLVVWSTW